MSRSKSANNTVLIWIIIATVGILLALVFHQGYFVDFIPNSILSQLSAQNQQKSSTLLSTQQTPVVSDLKKLGPWNNSNPNPYQLDISHFKFGKQIGKGGYSRVFLGKRITKPHTSEIINSTWIEPNSPLEPEDFDYAIKVIHKARYFRAQMLPNPYDQNANRRGVNQQLLSEAVWSERNAWVAFSVPRPIRGIMPLRHIFQDDDAIYYVVPFINGGDLDTATLRRGPFNELTMKYYTATIITALEGMHARGYVYKDVKMKNLLLTAQGYLQITDFGLSRRQSPEGNCVTSGIRGRAGTRSYKSPEVLRGTGHSYPSDFYSLGVILYRLLTNYKLYHSEYDLPSLTHQLRIPKYHTFSLPPGRWRGYGVTPQFYYHQENLQKKQLFWDLLHRTEQSTNDDNDNDDSDSDSNVATYINPNIPSLFPTSLQKQFQQRSETHSQPKLDEPFYDMTNKNVQKTLQEHQWNALVRSASNQERKTLSQSPVWVDGVGPIFTDEQAEEIRNITENYGQYTVNNTLQLGKGDLKGRFAWLSLSDELIDFLQQLVELNPYYRLGTNQRYHRDNNDYKPDEEQPIDPTTIPEDNTLSPPNLPGHMPIIQDYNHTVPALISIRHPFIYDDEVSSLEKKIDEEIALNKSKNIQNIQEHPHCFPVYRNLTQQLPSFRGKDENGKWKGLHSGFSEIKNHPWFNDFDWDTLSFIHPVTGKRIPGNTLVQDSLIDVRRADQKFPDHPDPKDDPYNHQWAGVFKNLDFNTRL